MFFIRGAYTSGRNEQGHYGHQAFEAGNGKLETQHWKAVRRLQHNWTPGNARRNTYAFWRNENK